MLQQPHRLAGLFVGIVLVLEHDIFERDAAGVGGAGVGGAGFEQFLDAVFLVERDDFVADFLGHRVKRNRQIYADFVATALHRRNDAAGRQRNASFRQRQPVAVHDQLQRALHIVEIVERLAHSHHDDVGQQAAVRSVVCTVLFLVEARHAALRPFAQRIAGEHDLADDFARREIAHEAHGACVAEAAVQRATDLARHAQRAAIRIGDEDHFELMPVGSLEQPLAGTIGRMLRRDHFGAANDETLGQPRAHGLGDIGHRLEFGDTAMVEPVKHLLGAQLGLLGFEPGLFEQFADAVLGQADEVHAAIGARRDITRDGYRVYLPGDAHKVRIGHGSGAYSAKCRESKACARVRGMPHFPLRSHGSSHFVPRYTAAVKSGISSMANHPSSRNMCSIGNNFMLCEVNETPRANPTFSWSTQRKNCGTT